MAESVSASGDGSAGSKRGEELTHPGPDYELPDGLRKPTGAPRQPPVTQRPVIGLPRFAPGAHGAGQVLVAAWQAYRQNSMFAFLGMALLAVPFVLQAFASAVTAVTGLEFDGGFVRRWMVEVTFGEVVLMGLIVLAALPGVSLGVAMQQSAWQVACGSKPMLRSCFRGVRWGRAYLTVLGPIMVAIPLLVLTDLVHPLTVMLAVGVCLVFFLFGLPAVVTKGAPAGLSLRRSFVLVFRRSGETLMIVGALAVVNTLGLFLLVVPAFVVTLPFTAIVTVFTYRWLTQPPEPGNPQEALPELTQE